MGQGSGNLRPDRSILRIITGTGSETATDPSGEMPEDQISILETCIDDMNPELFGYLMNRLFADGALDVYWIPVYMNRFQDLILTKVE